MIITLGSAVAGIARTRGKPESRWESNLSIGYIRYTSIVSSGSAGQFQANRHLGIIKSISYYPLPSRLLSVGVSVDYIIEDLAFSLNGALNLPLKRVIPFVSAGAGIALSGTTLLSYGTGIKLRLGGTLGLIAEFRHFRTRKDYGESSATKLVSGLVVRHSDFIGLGITYLY